MKRGRPLMLRPLNEKVKNFLMILRRKEEVVNSVVAIAVAQGLIEKSTEEYLQCIDLIPSTWLRVFFKGWDL